MTAPAGGPGSVFAGAGWVELDAPDFGLALTLTSGQSFQWRRTEGGVWWGAVGEHLVEARQEGTRLFFRANPALEPAAFSTYLGLADDYRARLERLRADPALAPTLARLPGLRILQQDPFETLVAFIISANNLIAKIEMSIERLSRRYGCPLSLGPRAAHAFPSLAALSTASLPDLQDCLLGYRAPYLLGTLQLLQSHAVELESLRGTTYELARQALRRLPGVGAKVADCVLLFGLGHHEAFPVDVWVKRAIEETYFGGEAQPVRAIEEFGRARWGADAGYAQQFIFVAARAEGRARPSPAGG